MKIIIILMLLASGVWAQEWVPNQKEKIAASTPSADQGFLQLMRDKLSETRPVVLLSPYIKPAYSLFLPVWAFHNEAQTQDIFEVGLGGKYETESKSASAFLGADFNLVALSARLWNWSWARTHVRRTKFPPIFVGPAIISPQDYAGLKTMSLKRDLRLLISVAIRF